MVSCERAAVISLLGIGAAIAHGSSSSRENREDGTCSLARSLPRCGTRIADAVGGHAELVTFELAIQRRAIEPEDLRGLRLVLADSFHHTLDVAPLDFFHRDEVRRIFGRDDDERRFVV